MKGNNTEQISIKHDVTYHKIKCLVLASYYLGQETGLKGMTYQNKEAERQRDLLVTLILKDIK